MYTKAALSKENIDRLLNLWNATLVPYNDSPPILDHNDLHSTIDAIKVGGVPWQSYTAKYNGSLPDGAPAPEWMTTEYQVWYRDPRKVIHNMFANPDLVDCFDYVPYRDFMGDKRRYCDFMSGDWAWKQCVSFTIYIKILHVHSLCYYQDLIAADTDTDGAMFVPIILGSDKTTVSVATGQHEYHPIYLSVGNAHNHIQQAHKEALVLLGFLPIPKGA